jgi:hypothetical protein
LRKLIDYIAGIYDPIENYWNSQRNHKLMGSMVVLVFLSSIFLILLKHQNLLPDWLNHYTSTNFFIAVEVAFVVLLFFEVMSLVFMLPYSVARSLHKQFEIISLILLRNAFKEFSHLTNNISWETNSDSLLNILSNSVAAIIIFGGIFVIRSIRIHRPITTNDLDQIHFKSIKKVVSLMLLLGFIILIIQDTYLFFNHADTFKLFNTFYTILIFSDLLLVMISLRYNYNYIVLFRNSGFAFATVLLRMALTAPIYLNSILAIFAIIYVFLLTLIYQQMHKKGFYAQDTH